MKRAPDFYLTRAGEMRGLAEPRACWEMARLTDSVRDDYMLVEIDPPLKAQNYGWESAATSLLLSSRLQGFSLFPVTEWPCPVYVARVVDDLIRASLRFSRGQVELIAWGQIFRTREEANALATRF